MGAGNNPHINGWLTDTFALSTFPTPPNPLGTRYWFEGAEFEFVRVQEAALTGAALRYDPAYTKQCDRSTSTNSGGGGVAGALLTTITEESWAWIQKKGPKTSVSPTLITDGNVVATTGLTSTTDGTFTPTAALEEIDCGKAWAADTGTSLASYYLECA